MSAFCLLASLPAQIGPDIQAGLDEFLRAPALAGARIGVEVRDLGTGEVLCAHDADKGFLTASNMKLLSAAVALEALGPDFVWQTRVLCRAQDMGDGAVLEGDVFLLGGGDPSLGGPPAVEGGAVMMAAMDALARQIADRGVRRITGRVLGDGGQSPFPLYGQGWQWDYLEEDYAAPVGGLNFGLNVVLVRVLPTKAGQPAQLVCEPEVPTPWLRNEAVTVEADGKAQVGFGRAPHGPTVLVKGAVPEGGAAARLLVAVDDPARYAAECLQIALERQGVRVEGGAAGAGHLAHPGDLLATLDSPPLREVVVPLLRSSINLYAEQVWREAALRGKGLRTFGDCEAFAKETLQQIGVPTDGMILADGSGLSRRNLVQPQQLTALLARMRVDPALAPMLPGLPVAGQSGTLRGRMKAGPAAGRVRAKTGFVSYVAALSGYLDRPGPDGQEPPPLAFSILVNNFTCSTDAAKAAIDGFVEAMARSAGWDG